MYIARLLYPVRVLGPGNRIAVWFSGCEHQCFGCSNPELWEQKAYQNISMDALRTMIEAVVQNYEVDGFTLTGGDPFYQPDALRELLPFLKSISEDILVYTGFEFEYLCDNYKDILDYLAVVIDGKYVEEQNHGTMLRGSDNQKIIYLNKKIKSKYDHYLTEEHSPIQNFTTVDGVVSVGIHLPHYNDDLDYWAKKKGLKEEDNG